MKRFYLHDPEAGLYAVTVYGADEQDARRRYRENWYPNRSRLPKGVAVWEDN